MESSASFLVANNVDVISSLSSLASTCTPTANRSPVAIFYTSRSKNKLSMRYSPLHIQWGNTCLDSPRRPLSRRCLGEAGGGKLHRLQVSVVSWQDFRIWWYSLRVDSSDRRCCRRLGTRWAWRLGRHAEGWVWTAAILLGLLVGLLNASQGCHPPVILYFGVYDEGLL